MIKPDTLKLQFFMLDFDYQFSIQKSAILGINKITPTQKRERIYFQKFDEKEASKERPRTYRSLTRLIYIKIYGITLIK